MKLKNQDGLCSRFCSMIVRAPYKFWFGLAVLSFILMAYGLLDQEIRCNTSWNWDQFKDHESLIAIAFCVGVALLVVATIHYYCKKKHVNNISD